MFTEEAYFKFKQKPSDLICVGKKAVVLKRALEDELNDGLEISDTDIHGDLKNSTDIFVTFGVFSLLSRIYFDSGDCYFRDNISVPEFFAGILKDSSGKIVYRSKESLISIAEKNGFEVQFRTYN